MGKKKNVISDEHRKETNLKHSLSELKKRFANNILPKNPTRVFAVGDRIIYGAHKEVYILEVGEDNLYYKVLCKNVQRTREKPPEDEIMYVAWMHIYSTISHITAFSKEIKHRIRFANSRIQSLLHLVYHGGVDFDVEYQREHVWELPEKVALIDSIFNNINIGFFVFVERGYDNDKVKYYEIIDGKQRLTTLTEFYEDRFRYNGFLFSELSFIDKNRFEGHSISYGYLESPTQRDILETFIELNTAGKPMDIKHINHVKELLNELK